VLNIFKDLYINFTLKLGIVFLIFYAIVFFLLQGYGISFRIWIILAVLWLGVFGVIVVMLNTLHKKLDEDIAALSYYLRKLDSKKYDAEIKIKNYLEFLEIVLLLKNLVKRLHNKEKKSSKK